MPEPTNGKSLSVLRKSHPGADQEQARTLASGIFRTVTRINWPLLLGSLVVLLIIVIAIAGPKLAPHDPLEENTIIRIDEDWQIPPFPALTPGFPLGSDQFGRDLLSRLLWAVRPTMVMVAVVAVVRLMIGVAMGMSAGWFVGWTGRALDGIIGAALSVPVLMVALGAIAAIGIEVGIWAFIIGLSINGWVETARIVREQTRLVKGQLYVEAARALGSSDGQVIFRHVLRQIIPMAWMLFAFEISGTLMVTAALGFLGYYIGGDVWVLVDDTAARRISGTPELGQMLATSWVRADEPWGMIAVGSVIFVTVLGFNLLGRGLRDRLSLSRISRRKWTGPVQRAIATHITEPAGRWMDQQVWAPLKRQARRKGFVPILTGVMILFVGLLLGWRLLTIERVANSADAQAIERIQLWSTARGDAYGTLWTHATKAVEPEVAWVLADPAGFAGGPAVSETGIVYIATKSGVLYAVDAQGGIIWQASLPSAAVGTPALGRDGQVYVSDQEGNLSAFSADGTLQWRYTGGADGFATSGPIISVDGNAYYMVRGGTVQAVSGSGEELWQTRVADDPLYSPPRLSADEQWLFVKDTILDAQTGALRTWEAPLAVDQYLTGADGQNYLQSGNEIVRWRQTDPGIEIIQSVTWDYRQFTTRTAGGPTDAGVTPSHLIWLLYSGKYEDTRIVWIDAAGHTVGNAHYAQRLTEMIAVDQQGIAYACGSARTGGTECLSSQPGGGEPLWRVALEDGSRLAGGAVAPGRLYAAMEEGYLYAIGEGKPTQVADQVPDRADQERTATPLGPDTSEIAWSFQHPAGFSSGPTVGQDGSLYITSGDGTLFALDANGVTLWETNLPSAPVGSPALGRMDEIYVVDKSATLSAFARDGSLLWRFQPPESKPPTVGPTVGPEGTIYYNTGSKIQAVSPAGEGQWQAAYKTFRAFTPLQVSDTGELLFFADDVISTQHQALIEPETPVDVDRFLVGGNGKNYLRSKHTLMQWQLTGSQIEIIHSAQWNYGHVVSADSAPTEAGVARGGQIWLLYTSEFGSSRIAWVDGEGQILGTASDEFSTAEVVDVLDENLTTFACGYRNRHNNQGTLIPQCRAFTPGEEGPVWSFELQTESEQIAGGALAPGRLYLATENALYAIGNGQPAQAAVEGPSLSRSSSSTGAPTSTLGPTAEEIAWTFAVDAGFASGPAVSPAGTLYVGSQDGMLHAIDAAGSPLWSAELSAPAIGPPAVSSSGQVYVADKDGTLSAFAPNGTPAWRFQPADPKPGTVGPLVGPDGTIYYTVGHSVQAVSPTGEARWQTRYRTFRAFTPLQLDATGSLLFFADDVIDATDGTLISLETPIKSDQYIAGRDGRLYLRARHTVMQWVPDGSAIDVMQSAQWNYEAFVTRSGQVPAEAGVTANSVIWLMYTHSAIETQLVWLSAEGEILGTAKDDNITDSQVIGVLDEGAKIYVCGIENIYSSSARPHCKAFVPGNGDAVWQVELGRSDEIKGGALSPGRLYVTTGEGVLYALGGAGAEIPH